MRNLDTLLVQEGKRLGLVDEQRVGAETSEVLIIEVPLEIGPEQRNRSLARERSLLLTRSHAPYDERLVVDARSVRIARHQVVLTRREVDELHAVVRESRELNELFARPQRDTAFVERRQVRAFRRPLESRLGPFLTRIFDIK